MAISEQLKKAAINDFVENTKALGRTSVSLKDIRRFVITCPLYVGKVIKSGINLDDATAEDFEEVIKDAHYALLKADITFACGDIAFRELAKTYLTVVRAINSYETIYQMI